MLYQQIDILKTTVEELNKEIADKNMTIEQMQNTVVTQDELVDRLTEVTHHMNEQYHIHLIHILLQLTMASFFNTNFLFLVGS